MNPAEIEARLLYRDGLVLILDKPAGLPVHAGPGGGDNFERHFRHLQFGLPHPPALAHRLDRDTSGCLILGRHRKALAKLGRLFSAGQVSKVYWAIVRHRPPAAMGRIDQPLKKLSTRQDGWRMVKASPDDPDGKPAITDYRLLDYSAGLDLAWLELRPLTGRTHQIRVHLAALGTPILGDRQYGEKEPQEGSPGGAGLSFPGLFLHARSVDLPLYPKKPPIHVEAPPPPAFAAKIERISGSAGPG